MNLEELLKETDALTYINSLKVTLMEIKNEVSGVEEMADYFNQASERIRKLMRKADNQYRLIAKILNHETPIASDVVVENNADELKELMEE